MQKGPLCVLLALLLLLEVHQQPSAAIMFDIPPQTRECFFVKSQNQQSEVVGSYQTFFGDGSVRVTVEGPVPSHRAGAQLPQLTPIFSSMEESGRIQAPMELSGDYAVCVRNVLSFEQTVTIDFHVQSHKQASHPNQLALEDEALKLKTLTADVLEKANSLFEQQSHAMVRMGVHAELGESTRRRATLWKCIQMGMQLLLAGIQIYSVKSYFEVKTIVDKPAPPSSQEPSNSQHLEMATQGVQVGELLFAAAVIRHMHRMAGQWDVTAFEDRTIIRQKARGQKRVERVFLTVEGISPSAINKLPIVFASGAEFLEALFMIMAIMKAAAMEKDAKKLLEFVPLLNAWAVVARHEMAYFAFVTYPMKHVLAALSSLPSSKAQTDHLAKIEKLQMEVHKEFSGIDKEEIELQLDLSNPMEKAVFEHLLLRKIPLVNYHRHGSFFREALQSKGSFFQAVEKSDVGAEDLSQSLLYRGIGVFFEHSKSSEIKRFLSVKFWEDEAKATQTMEETLARTNHYVSTACLHVSALVSEINDQFKTAEEEAKSVSDDVKSRIVASGKSFVDFAASASPEALGILIGEHKTHSHRWLKDLVFSYGQIKDFCTAKPTYCKLMLREFHKIRMKQALAVEEFKLMLRGILASSGVVKQEKLLKTMIKELQLVGSQLKVPRPPKTTEEEETVKQEVERKKEVERKEQIAQAAEVEKTQKQEEGEKEETPNGGDDAGGGIGGTSFVWNDLKQFLIYAMLRVSLQSLAYALTHPAQSDKVPSHLISRLATDCYFLGKHPDVQAKVGKAAEGVEEAKAVNRFDKYFAGFVATCCNALAVEIYKRTMKEKDLGAPMAEDSLEENLKDALRGMGTWRNRMIIPELEKKGMEPPAVKEMQLDVIGDTMNKALKSLAGIATVLRPRCSNSKKILKVGERDLQNYLRDFSFEAAPTAPLILLANNVCYAYYLNEGGFFYVCAGG
ncbi:hypothetical protein Efla_003333 [Eimeria flavescens]